MSVFPQYTPYELASGDWDGRRRGGDADLILDGIEAYAPDVRECIEHMQVLGAPDIEEGISLSGGHVFQGEALPFQMWDRRLDGWTPVPGLYLSRRRHAPGGSVIALNGRGAARTPVADQRPSPRLSPLTPHRDEGAVAPNRAAAHRALGPERASGAARRAGEVAGVFGDEGGGEGGVASGPSL